MNGRLNPCRICLKALPSISFFFTSLPLAETQELFEREFTRRFEQRMCRSQNEGWIILRGYRDAYRLEYKSFKRGSLSRAAAQCRHRDFTWRQSVAPLAISGPEHWFGRSMVARAPEGVAKSSYGLPGSEKAGRNSYRRYASNAHVFRRSCILLETRSR